VLQSFSVYHSTHNSAA